MFATIGHTFELMKMSWRVLMLDRELIFFPLLAGISVLILALVFIVIGDSTGTIDTLSSEESQKSIADYILPAAFIFLSSASVIFFNAALVAAALERLRGGDPNIKSGLRAASVHLPQILAWALISVIVAMLLAALRRRGGGGQIAAWLGGAAWGLATFFVIPVLVSEGVGPIEAIKRSAGLFRKTWGRQATSEFGFGIIMIVALLIALLPSYLLFLIHPVLGIAAGVPLVAIAVGTVQALQGIFKAALYDYANGHQPHGFDRATLEGAYRSR
jgi:hypothetical protein